MCHFCVRTRLARTTRPASVAESEAMPSARLPLLWACPMAFFVQAAITSGKGDAQPQVDACNRREGDLSTVGLTDNKRGCCRLCAPCVKRSSWALRNRATTKVCSAVTWRSRSGKATCTVLEGPLNTLPCGCQVQVAA